MVHCRIGSHTHTIDLILRKVNASAHLMNHRVDRFFDHCVLQFFDSTRFRCLNDTVDNIRTITDLSVTGGTLGKDFTRSHIDDDSRNGCCTNIYCESTHDHVFFCIKNIIDKHIIRCYADHTFH